MRLSPDYPAARAAFIAAATAAGARQASYPHPLQGPAGEALSVDVAELGPADAEHVVLVTSATHGVEGYCGSALQTEWLTNHLADRPEGVRVIHVHALNPFGMAWHRRVNEDNVDLNRNFPDWSQPLPANPGYEELADVLVPADWSPAEQQRTTEVLLTYAAENGFPQLQTVVSGGQYTVPTGIFYGGNGPVWSHRFLREFCATALAAARRVTIIDLHTGLGPWGVGELIASAAPGDPLFDRAKVIWDDAVSMMTGDSVSAVLAGDWNAVADELAPHAVVTPMTIEYGVVDLVTVLQSLRADAWLWAHGDPRGPEAPAIRAQVRAAFADDDPSWIETCWPRYLDTMNKALKA